MSVFLTSFSAVSDFCFAPFCSRSNNICIIAQITIACLTRTSRPFWIILEKLDFLVEFVLLICFFSIGKYTSFFYFLFSSSCFCFYAIIVFHLTELFCLRKRVHYYYLYHFSRTFIIIIGGGVGVYTYTYSEGREVFTFERILGVSEENKALGFREKQENSEMLYLL